MFEGKIYRGYRLQQVCIDGSVGPRLCVVTVERPPLTAYQLPPRTDLVNHSPTGFEWGVRCDN